MNLPLLEKKLDFMRPHLVDAARVGKDGFLPSVITKPPCQPGPRVSTGLSSFLPFQGSWGWRCMAYGGYRPGQKSFNETFNDFFNNRVKTVRAACLVR
jgi:hypothetical protein